MFAKLRRKFVLPRIRPELAMGVLMAWGVSLLVLDYGAKLEATAPVPMVTSPELCDLDRAPAPDDVVHVLAAGETVLVRNTREAGRPGACYEVETHAGQRGWLPWHPDYLRGAGVYVRVGG